MKTMVAGCLAMTALSGCATLDEMTSAKKMEAVEVFRGDVDQATFPEWAACNDKNAPDKSKANNAIPLYGARAETVSSPTSRTNGDSVTRAFICAMRAEHLAYQSEIDQIKSQTQPAGQVGIPEKKTDTVDPRKHLLYWQQNLANDAIAVANMNCDYHFRDTEIDRANIEFRQGSLNTVASAIGAGLASLTSHNRTIFNLATVSTAANSITTQYKSTVFLTPLLRKLHSKLDQPRKDVAGTIRAMLTLDTIPRVMALKAKLVEYEQLCSRESLVEILSQAVDIPRYEAPSGISIQAQNEAKQLTTALVATSKKDAATMTEKMIKQLWIISNYAVDDRNKLVGVLSNDPTTGAARDLGDIAAALFAETVADDSKKKLNRIVVLLQYDDNADVAVLRSALDKQLADIKDKEKNAATVASAEKTANDKNLSKADKVEAAKKEADAKSKLEASAKMLQDNSAVITQLLNERRNARDLQPAAKSLDDVRVRIFALPSR